MQEPTFSNANFNCAIVVGQSTRRLSRKNFAVVRGREVTIDGAISVFQCFLQILDTSIRMQLEFAAQWVLIKGKRTAMVRLIFRARVAVVEGLEPI